MAIDTNAKLQAYILRQLGSPYVTVEVHTDTLNDIIEETIKEFSQFAFEGEVEDSYILNVNGKGVYTLPAETQAILKLSRGSGMSPYLGVGSGLVLSYDMLTSIGVNLGDMISRVVATSAQISMLNQYFGDQLNYSFNYNSKKLTILQPYIGPVLVHIAKEYVPEAIDRIYDHIWIRKMTTARARLAQSVVLGKYDQALVGGARVNYNDMRSQAQEEMEILREELLTKFSGPAPILVG